MLEGESLLDPQLAAQLLRQMFEERQKKEEPAEAPPDERGEALLPHPLSPREEAKTVAFALHNVLAILFISAPFFSSLLL